MGRKFTTGLGQGLVAWIFFLEEGWADGKEKGQVVVVEVAAVADGDRLDDSLILEHIV
jgi:hypothetical protein